MTTYNETEMRKIPVALETRHTVGAIRPWLAESSLSPAVVYDVGWLALQDVYVCRDHLVCDLEIRAPAPKHPPTPIPPPSTPIPPPSPIPVAFCESKEANKKQQHLRTSVHSCYLEWSLLCLALISPHCPTHKNVCDYFGGGEWMGTL